MTHRSSGVRDNLWSVILAGGEGERTRDFVLARLGHRKPKQYCTFVGTRSLLQHTIDRADRLSPSSRRVVVVAAHHRGEVELQLASRARGKVLLQPKNRGTAPGVFLALSYIASRDPDATVVIYPSDHFICPERAFVGSVDSAVALSAELPESVVLLGVRPRAPETEYGWISLGAPVPSGSGAHYLSRFVEKPSRSEAEQLFRSRGLWSTSVVVGRLATIWALGWRHLPEILLPWIRVGSGLLEATDGKTLDDVYREMPVRDFARQLLEPAAANLVVLESKGFYWSDWGHPARILETLLSLEHAESHRFDERPLRLEPFGTAVLPGVGREESFPSDGIAEAVRVSK